MATIEGDGAAPDGSQGEGSPPAAPATPPAPAGTLLESGTPGEGTPPAGDPPGEWFLSDGVKGEGAAPEWFKADKYKSVADQAKAYPELAKKLGAFTGAPEAYELSLPEGVEGEFDSDNPILQRFIERAKESGMSQDLFTSTLHDFVEYVLAADTGNVADVKAALGPKADARIDAVRSTLAAQLPDDQYQALIHGIKDAASFEAIEALVQGKAAPPVPLGETDTTTMKAQLNELRNERNEQGQRLYDQDPKHRAKVREMYSRIYGDAPAREVVGGG
jgi:hypothetical protein